MNILFLNTTYLCGGAEKVTNQIFNGMRARGHNVYEIVSYYKRTKPLPPGISVLYQGTPMLLLNRLITKNHSNSNLTIPYSRYRILHFIKEKHIDIIHLHNAHGNFLGIHDIQAIADVCPVVWTVHDFWPLTGHCASPSGCADFWINGCNSCPQLQNYPPLKKDCSHYLWKEKAKTFSHPNIHFAVPSNWMLSQLKQSHLKNTDYMSIPNSLDTNVWIPYNKKDLREEYHLPSNKHIVAFVAADPTKKSKGMYLLLDALQKLSNPEQYLLLIAGQTKGLESINNSGFSIRHFGYLTEQKQMNEFYSLADVLVNPSLYETFGLVNIEAMSSGTPVIAFSICAMDEIITPDCGWCIPPGDNEQLAQTIHSAFTSESILSKMSVASRKRVVDTYSEPDMLTAYENLYKKVVTK
ncbi:MAG: glycosyltransferase [Clostridiales bacterium]|nr:glycosyltransferase [Clostridiales bacterium]